jgi:hypothetical protein
MSGTPSKADYWNLTTDVFRSGAAPSGWTRLTDTNSDSAYAANGVIGAAYINNTTHQVVIAFGGANTSGALLGLSSSSLSIAAEQNDLQILQGSTLVVDKLSTQANNFYKAVETSVENYATQNNFTFTPNANDVFVTGNSGGGVTAALLAKNQGFGGATFGTPGIPGLNGDPNPSNFISYENAGDPVGQYGSDTAGANLVSTITALSNNGTAVPMAHYGTMSVNGSPSETTGLSAVYSDVIPNITTSSGTGNFQNLLGDMGVLGYDIFMQHTLPNYNPSSTSPPDNSTENGDLFIPFILGEDILGNGATFTAGQNGNGDPTLTGQSGTITVTGTVSANSAGDYLVNYVQQTSGQPISQQGWVQIADSGQFATDASVYDTSGSETSTTIQTGTASAGVQNTAEVNFGAGSSGSTTVTVTVLGGSTTGYTVSGTPTVDFAMDGATTAAGQSDAVLIGGYNGTLTGGSGQNLLLELGNDGTVDGGSGTNQIFLAGTGETVNASGSTITLEDSTQATLTGNNNTIVGGNADTLTVDGTGDTLFVNGTADVVNVTAGDVLAISSNASATLTSGGVTVDLNGTTAAFIATSANGNQTITAIPLPPTPSYANPQVTQTYDSSTNQLTLWNSVNNAAEIVQFASASTTEITQISDAQFIYNSSGQLQGTNIENYNTLNQETSADYFTGNNVQIWTYDPSTGAATNEQDWSGNTLVNQLYFSNNANQSWSSYQVNYNNSLQMTSQDIFEKTGSVQIWNFNAPSTSAASEQSWDNNQLQSQTFFNWNNNTNLNWSAQTDYYNYTNASNPSQINSEAVFLNSGINQLWLYNLQYYDISNETVQQWQGNQLENEILFPNTSAANWSYVYVPFSNGVAQSATYYNSSGDIVNPTYAVASLPPPQQPPSSSTSSVTGTGGGGAGSAPGSVVLDASAAAAAAGDAVSAAAGGPSVIGTVITTLGDLGGAILGLGTVRGASNLQNIVSQSDLAAGLPAAASAADAAWVNMEQNLAAAKSHALGPSPFEGAEWANAVITWNFADSPGSRSMPFSGYVQKRYQAAIEAAIQTWSNASGLKFKQVSGSSTADIRIGWGNFNTQNSGIIGLTGGQVAGGQFQPGTIVRLENPAQDPIVSSSGGLEYAGTDVQLYQLALHEIGHALGLADTSDPNSVMFANLGTTNRSLDATDTANIKTLYGSGSLLGSGSSGVLAQAMASFDPLSSSGSTQPSPPLTALEPTLAASMHH